MSDSTRRRFLEMVGGACAASLAGCSSGSASPAPIGDVPAGNASALTVGTLVPVASEPVCIGRDAGGIYAMTLTCTHQGCDIGNGGTVSFAMIRCPCHGSQFDANGNVVNGPAETPLVHYAVSQDTAGNLTIHGGTEVSESTRLAVA
jgi:cytochrome b6-f complex iron-sulfur subunit